MSVEFELSAESRDGQGKGASRRLRRQGRLPAVIYGGGAEPQSISLEHREVAHQLKHEGFYSHILTVKLDGTDQQVVLRDLQRHPYKPQIMHMDLQRVTADEELTVRVPLHFVNESTAVGVKEQGGVVSHLMIDVEIACLPRHLPEFIEVDLAQLGMGESIHLSELKLPEGVSIPVLSHGEEYDQPVVNIHHARKVEEEEGEEGEGEEGPAEEGI